METEVPKILKSIKFADSHVSGPVSITASSISWRDLDSGESVELLAPPDFVRECVDYVTSLQGFYFTVRYKHEPMEDGRVLALITCEENDHGQICIPIPAEQSPNGKPLTLVKRVTISPRHTMSKKRQSWPFKDLNPGEAVELHGPKAIMNSASMTARSYIHPALDRVVKSKRLPVQSDGTRKVFVWCEELGGSN